ncbi:MAG: sulfotransferase family protein [Pirellulales bacterium]|nr:sulfotransferase family protein [Pirellulales bacterium]
MTQRDYLTIVSGLPRSGTSMMMKMIEKGGIPVLIDNIRTADEDNPNGYYEYEPVKKTKEDSSWVAGGMGKVVKMVHLLLLDLPLDYKYRVIFMRRHLDEVVKSQNVMLERHGENTADLPPAAIKKLYLSQIDKVQQYVDTHPQCFEMIEIDYNEMLANPGPCVEQISDLLDGLDKQAMLGVVDPKLYRNRVAT